MRLIDADAIEEKAEEVMEKKRVYVPMMLFMEEIIDQLPTIDAVQIVRCKDCKKYRPIFKQALPLLGTCDICGIMRETDYCSMGERREE